jgi:hypothetical protein
MNRFAQPRRSAPREDQKNVRRRVRLRGPLQGLQLLADGINAVRDLGQRRQRAHGARRKQLAVQYAAWKAAEAILLPALPLSVSDSLPQKTVRRFNQLAQRVPMSFHLDELEAEEGRSHLSRKRSKRPLAQAVFRYADFRGYVLQALWFSLQSRMRDRLKRCPQCQKWFVDESRNKSAKRCSASCTWRSWNRRRRRESRQSR